jgi:uncharacterized protein YtpQ (UPF0354 family)
MEFAPLKKFDHPHSVYHLEYPAHWDQITEKDGASCGFGPHERDNVGLWISIMPMSVDTDRLAEVLPGIMRQALDKCEASELRAAPTLRHYALTADIIKEGEGGHYWIIAGGDVVLFASSQVPADERDVWNPPFQRLMDSLTITRDDQLLDRKVVIAVMDELKKQYPDQEFTVEGNRIKGAQHSIYLGNLCNEVRGSTPQRREEVIKRFVSTLTQPAAANIGYETWEEAQKCLLPLLKPRAYVVPNTATEHLLTTEWLADVLIVYAITKSKMYRFVTGWDVNRWETTAAEVHDRAMANLEALPWPREFQGARFKNDGRLFVVQTDDGLASSRLLHLEAAPDVSHPARQPLLGWHPLPRHPRPLLRSQARTRTERTLAKDHDTSAYPISPKPFLVTPDGIAPGGKK